jgi:hypothetical protein
MKLEKEETIYKESTSDRIPDFIGNIIFLLIITVMILTILALFTIIGVGLASAIWGDYAVIYWLADLI